MKRILIILVGTLTIMAANAQSVKPLEFELFGGVTTGLGNAKIKKPLGIKLGFGAGIEARYNLANNMDIALQGSVATLGPASGQCWIYATALFFADYQINMQSSILSVGLGIGIQDKVHSDNKFGIFKLSLSQDEKTGFCVAPRVSYRVSDHVRLSLTDYIANKTHNTLCLSVGYVF